MVMGLVVLVLAAQPEVCCSTVEECFTRLSAKGSEPADPPDPRPSVRQCEAQALARFGEPVVPRLLTLLKSNRWPVRDGAADALSLISPPPTVAVPALIACLKRDQAGAALHALRVIDDPRAAPSIVDALAHGAAYLELKPAIWNAALLPAVEVLVSPTTDNRDIILQLLQDQPESKPSLDVARVLHRQLRQLANARPSARPSACKQRRPNSIQLGPCLPTTGYLMLALERFGPEAGFAITDIERALAKDPDALEVVASVALVSLGAPSARARITQKLASATVETVEDGLFEFMHFPPEGTLPVLVKGLLTHPAPRVAGLAGYALARRGDSSGLDAAKAELSSVDYDRVELALATISSLGKLAPDGPSLMQQVLKNHPSARIRQVAARALGPVDGLEVPVPPVDCGVRRGEFAGLPSSLLHTVGDTFLIGTDNGEWGGELVEQRDGHDRRIAENINVRGFFTKGSTLFVFDGIEHLRRVGHVWRVVHEGGTHLELVTDLPGSPHAWRLDGSTLTVITHGELQTVDCKERVFSVVLP